MKTFIEELKWRESFKQSIGEENKLSDLIENKKISVYVGTDPTAPSLHIGHLIPLTILKRLQKLGHKPVIVVGGGTGMIGDPKPTTERKLLSEDQLNEYVQRLTKQLTKLFGSDGFEIINNYNWLGKLSLIEFLRDYGKFFPVNEMLKRDVVANRIETGISFTEFTYQILQAIDFLVLYKEKKVQLQIGGSDQFGNISSGVELIHKVLGSDKEAYGITVPLLLKSDGTKFGKSEGGAIWLDSQLTSPYNLYQFFFNQSDNDVIRFLKIFTFLSKEEIADYEEKVKNNPEKREAQTKLAEEVTLFLHGEDGLKSAKNITQSFFNGDVSNLTVDDLKQYENSTNTFIIEDKPINIVDLLVEQEFVEKSKRQAREDILNGAISINGEKITDVDFIINPLNKYDGKYILIKKGKKNNFLGKIND